VAKPRHQWSDHGLAITGLVVGCGGTRARVLTVSKDQVSSAWQGLAIKGLFTRN
jgi:hypothetical protein